MKRLTLCFALLSLALCSASEPGPQRLGSDLAEQVVRDHTWHCLGGTQVIDGDTVRACVVLRPGLVEDQETFRLLGYDAWESSKRRESVEVTDAEVVKGKAAQKALAELVGGSVAVMVQSEWKRDNYGRVLGYLRIVLPDGTVVKAEEWAAAGGHCRETNPVDGRQ